MTDDWQRKHERLFANDFRHTSHSFAKVDLFGTEHSDSLPFHSSINQSGSHYVNQIRDC